MSVNLSFASSFFVQMVTISLEEVWEAKGMKGRKQEPALGRGQRRGLGALREGGV